MRLNLEALLALNGNTKPAEPGTQCAVGWPGATLGAKVIEVQVWQESRQEPARSRALPDSFTALTQSLKVTAAMTS